MTDTTDTGSVRLMRGDLQKKVDFAIKLLRSIPTDEQPVEISYSGGQRF